jgi:hypothetical protein
LVGSKLTHEGVTKSVPLNINIAARIYSDMRLLLLLFLMTASVGTAKPGVAKAGRPATNAPTAEVAATNSLAVRHAAATEKLKLYYSVRKDPVTDVVTIKSLFPIVFEGGVELRIESKLYPGSFEPGAVQLIFRSVSHDWRFSDDDVLQTKVDGVRAYEGTFYYNYVGADGLAHETLSLGLEMGMWARMIRAKEVLFNLGDFLRAAEITPDDREKWKILLDYHLVNAEANKPVPWWKKKKKQ